MTPDLWLNLGIAVFGSICAGAGVYGAVKGDLARTRTIAENAKDSADKAHTRIDNIFSSRRG